MIETLIVIAKEPVAGKVKTRLVPPLSPQQAADVAAAALADTLDAVAATPCTRRSLAFDGVPDGWLRPGWRHCRQPAGGLDRRLVAAFGAAGRGPALLVGMDTPQLEPAAMAAFDPSRWDACLGPALDGGYWAIGLGDPTAASAAIADIPMSTAYTAEAQLARLRSLGMRVQLLDPLVDVDTITDAEVVAALAPKSLFAGALARATVRVA
jgi:glycosyltransferase A (GT-A) superfamily protein (DUF2064 family)